MFYKFLRNNAKNDPKEKKLKTLTGFLFSKTIGKFFCFLGLYISLIVNSQAAGFVNVSSLSISEIPVTIGQNFYIHFELKEYQNDWKYFEYIEVWIQDKNQKDLYPVKRWDNVSFSPNTRHGFLAITYLYTSRSPGDYFVVVRGKEYGKNPFNFGVVPNNYASCPYKFTAISPGKADVVFSNYGPGNSSLCVENGCTFWPQGIDTPSGPLPKFYGMAFTVPGTSSFKLDSISVTAFDMAYSTDSTMIPATLILSINEDLNGLPGAVLEQFTFSNFNSVINFEVPYSALLTGISTYRPKLSAGTQYWITADVSEPTRMEVGWASNNQGHAGFMVQRTGSEPWASLGYQYQPVLRVMGKPTSNPPKLQPEINSISPDSGLAGTSVTIKGNKFGATQEGSFVRFGLVQAAINSWSDNKIEAVAPSGPSGAVSVSVMTAAGISNVNKMFTYEVEPNITLNIQRVPRLSEQKFLYPVQLRVLLLQIAGGEMLNYGNSDLCYLGMMNAINYSQGGDFVDLFTDILVSGIFDAALGKIRTGNLIGDYLLKYSSYIFGSLIRDEPIDEATIKFIAENTMGYIAGNATNNFYAGELIKELTKKAVEKLLKQDGGKNGGVTWSLKGNNKRIDPPILPNTNIDGQFYYNPYTHYTTGIIKTTCDQFGGDPMKKRLYVIAYKVVESDTHSAEIVGGLIIHGPINLN